MEIREYIGSLLLTGRRSQSPLSRRLDEQYQWWNVKGEGMTPRTRSKVVILKNVDQRVK